MVERSETRWAASGGVSIAYQVVGSGPIDLVVAPGLISHVEFQWELPGYRAWIEALASFARVVIFDKRGSGMSDRLEGAPTFEERVDDIGAVMDAAGVGRAALWGSSEGGPMAVLYAAAHPDRVSHLVLYGTGAVHTAALGDPEEWVRFCEQEAAGWGTTTSMANAGLRLAPSLTGNDEAIALYAKWARLSATPSTAKRMYQLLVGVDVRHALSAVSAPTLVVRRRGDRSVLAQTARQLVDGIPGARFVELDGDDHVTWVGDYQTLAGVIEEFLTGQPAAPPSNRVLATVLFTDLVESTAQQVRVGDARWHDLLDEHDGMARRLIERYDGRFVKSTGDGLLATFDGPSRAVRCADELRRHVRGLGLAARAGLHAGEVERRGDDVTGVGVTVAARVCGLAGRDEVLVSRTVHDLLLGSDIELSHHATRPLKGVPGTWELFAVEA